MSTTSLSSNLERIHPDLIGGAQAAGTTLVRLADRLAIGQGVALGPLQREADARTLREIAEAATALAKALRS